MGKSSKTTVTGARLPNELRATVEAEATATGVPITDVIVRRLAASYDVADGSQNPVEIDREAGTEGAA